MAQREWGETSGVEQTKTKSETETERKLKRRESRSRKDGGGTVDKSRVQAIMYGSQEIVSLSSMIRYMQSHVKYGVD